MRNQSGSMMMLSLLFFLEGKKLRLALLSSSLKTPSPSKVPLWNYRSLNYTKQPRFLFLPRELKGQRLLLWT